MSGHDAPIGQEWSSARHDARDIHDLITEVLGHDVRDAYLVLGYLASTAPAATVTALLGIQHSTGGHAGGKCPDRCPLF